MKGLIFNRHKMSELSTYGQLPIHVNMLFTHIFPLLSLLHSCDTTLMTNSRLPGHLYHAYFISGETCTPETC